MKKIVMGIVAIALMSCLVGSAYATEIGDGLSPGFWKHNVGVHLGYKNGAYSDPPVYPGETPYVTKDNMEAFLDGLEVLGWNLQDSYNDLNTKGGGATGANIRVVQANLLNYAAHLFPYV